jgi:peptide/histidine transporter 3/4
MSCHVSGLGMVLAAVAVFSAGVLEIYRKKNLATSGGVEQNLSGVAYNASTLSMFLQVPQFVLIGGSEVFTFISGRLMYNTSVDALYM